MNRKIITLILLLVCIGFGVYANALRNDFVWDDENLILKDPYLQDFKYVFEFFKMPLGYSSTGERVLVPTYRPIQSISNLADYFLWGAEPLGYHLTNVVLHILVGILLFLLIFEISESRSISFFTSAIYLVHPVNVAGVAYISGRAEPLGAIFLLISFLTYIKTYEKKGRYCIFYCLISYTCYILGILSKEAVLVLPLLLLLHDSTFHKTHSLWKVGPYVFIVIIYGILRFTILRFTVFTTLINPPPLKLRLITCPNIIMQYIRLLFFPFNLHLGYLIKKPNSFWQAEYFMPSAFLIGILWLVFFKMRKKRLEFFGFAWFFITLFPFLNIVFQLNAPLAEHWLYIPAIGFLFGFISLVKGRILKKETFFNIFCSLLLVYFFMSTISTNKIWRSNETVFKNVIKYSPGNSTAHANLGIIYERESKLKEALGEFEMALKIDPEDEKAKLHIEILKKRLR